MARARTFPLGLLPPALVGKPRVADPLLVAGKRPTEERVRRPLRVLTAPVISSTPTIGQTLTSTLGSWSGEQPITYARQWLRDGVEISGATSDTYLLAVADYDADITCRITATNALGIVSAVSNALGPVAAVVPSNVVAPVVSGTPTEDETLSCTTGSWTGTTPISYTFQWRRDGSPILGATATTYTLVTADVGTLVDCVVTATNVGGSDSQDSNDLGPIASSGGVAPTITTPPSVSWTVEIGNSPTLTDPIYTGDAGTITWTLYRDGVADGTIAGVSKATAEAYVADEGDIGPELHFSAVVTNGTGSDSDVTSTVVFDDASYLPDTAIGVSTAGLTLADSDTTVDSWAASLGGLSATLTAPTAGQRPSYDATGGVGSRPLVTGDAVNDALVSAAAVNTGATIEAGYVGSYTSATVNRTVLALDDSSMYLWVSSANYWYHRASATGPSTPPVGGKTVATPTHASLDAVASGDINARIGGTIIATVAASAGAFNAAIALFARTGAGTNAGGAALQAWYIGPQLTADQRTHLRALLTYHTGVAC